MQLLSKYKELGITDTPTIEEEVFYEWLLELEALGYIHKIEFQQTFTLLEEVRISLRKNKIVRSKDEDGKTTSTETVDIVRPVLLQDLCYTPDFIIYWNEEALEKFVFINLDFIKQSFTKELKSKFYGHYLIIDGPDRNKKYRVIKTVIEIKGTFASRQNSSAITFPLMRKIMFQMHGLYVNKVVPLNKKDGLFASTFTPKSYLTTKTNKARKLAWTALSAEEYIAKLE